MRTGLMRISPILVALALSVYSSRVVWAQTSDTQSDGAKTSRTDTTEAESPGVNPTRTTETHTQSGNRAVDSQSIQRLGPDGNFEPYQDVEKETVHVNATTVRTIIRTFGRDSDGAKTLLQVSEEEKRTLPGGATTVQRSISDPDADGRLQLIQRQVQETKKISDTVEETKTTVMLPGGNGDLAPALQTQERRQQGANHTIDSQKTTLLPDGNGNWQVGEVKREKIRQEEKNRTTDETVSRSDLDGNLDQVSRTVTRESESAPGETTKTVETDSVDVPGSARDGGMHAVQVSVTTEKTSATGQQVTERQVEQLNPGNPESGLQVTTVSIGSVSPGASGSRGTQTVETRDVNGSLTVVSMGSSTSTGTGAVQVQIAPPQKPK
jgi:hypothetical protein